MKDSELLQFVHKTCEMGVQGLLDVKDSITAHEMKSAVDSQIKEYQRITGRTEKLLRSVGETPSSPGLMAKASSGAMSAMKLMADSSDSKIAEMVIQGNTMGITKGTKHLNDYSGDDPKVRGLARQLIETQQANVDQMKKFL